MKKFYALLASVAVASLISASAVASFASGKGFMELGQQKAFKTPNFEKIVATTPLINVDVNKIPENLRTYERHNALSRAEEDDDVIDFESFTQFIYYDYFFNFYDNVGHDEVKREKFLGVRSSTESALEVTETGLVIKNFLDYKDWDLPLEFEEIDGVYCFTASYGQVLYSQGDGVEKQDWVLASFDDEGKTLMEGKFVFDIYLDGIVCGDNSDALGIMIINHNSKLLLGWEALTLYPMYIQPNATIEYTQYATQEGKEDLAVSNRIYVDKGYLEKYGILYLSNVTLFNAGCEIELKYDANEEVFLAKDQIAYPSEYYNREIGYSGNFDLVSYVINNPEDDPENWEGENQPFVFAKETETGLEFGDSANYDGDDYAVLYWTGFNDNLSMWYGPLSKAKITLDELSSVKPTVKDEFTAGAPVYYNLQGMKVANPQAGHIYIKKEGSKISKVLVK